MAKKRKVSVKKKPNINHNRTDKKPKSKSGKSKSESDLSKKTSPTNKSQSKTKLGRRIRFLFVCLIWFSLLTIGLVVYITHDLPKVSSLTGPKSSQSLRILTSDGSPLMSFGNQWGSYISVDEISPLLTQAVIATEDRRFYQHSGMDVFGLVRAIWRNIIAGSFRQGGSTITQQLAKIAFLTPKKTIKRKLQELFLAFGLEQNFTKDEILSLYLNRVYLGSGTYGVDAAARRYFGKSPNKLSLSEAAIIAGLLKAPSRYSPASNPKLARERALTVMDTMISAGFISSGDKKKAKDRLSQSIFKAAMVKKNGTGNYFTDWLRPRVSNYIGNNSPALTISTTLDSNLQRIAEETLSKALLKYKGSSVSEGAIVVMSPNGSIRAMVGGKDYKSSKFNRSTQALRQPGSAFKTIVYIAGLEAGLSPDDIFSDTPIEISGWKPQNYNGSYKGPVTLRQAFAESINSVAVRVAQYVGIKDIINLAKRFGISSSLPSDASLSLGTGEVSLIELTAVYASLSNDGSLVFPHGITRIDNRGGETLYSRKISGTKPIISNKTLLDIRDLLATTVSQGTGSNAALPPSFHGAYGKTGTSQNFRDAWFIGFADKLVVGIWLGNDNEEPMKSISGGGAPAMIWRDFMLRTRD